MSLEADKEKPEQSAESPLPSEGGSSGKDFEATTAGTEESERVRRLQAEKQELTDQLQRKQAELENFRKRVQREKEEFLQYSLVSTLQELLPVLDGFELALETSGSGEEYRKGVELIYQQFRGILQKLGLQEIESKGREFDPYLHEAVATVETEEYPDQQIIEELQRGYSFRHRLVRPSRVKVAKRPASAQARPATDVQPE